MTARSRYELDTGRLADAIETIKRHRAISARQVAAETGLSPSTLTRLSQGQKPDADALVSLLTWLQTDAALFTRPRLPEFAGSSPDGVVSTDRAEAPQ